MAYVMTYKSAGEEISSTYEGRHITLLESQLIHPTHGDAFVNKGDPVLIGTDLVGVAFNDASADTDLIAIDTEGIWALSCVATNYSGNSAIAAGDRLYISSAGIVSKNDHDIPFGYALSALTTGYTGIVAVKVHAGTAVAQP
jgi:hypothetical protein